MNKNITNYLNNAKKEVVEEEPIFNLYIDPNKNVIDIGGCVGVMSMIMSKITNKNVYTYEPNPASFNLLENNIKNNGIKNVKVFNLGIGHTLKKTKIIFSHPDNIGQTMLGITEKHLEDSDGVDVNLIKLDDIDVDNIGFIKIDVEGYELEVLRSGEKFFKKHDPIVCIEYHGFNVLLENGREEWRTTESKVNYTMLKYGYTYIDKIGNKIIFEKYKEI
tara:strand:+ start:169 stop:825 length:657 start_codon:yes stop_codon:yes gene_type:complete